ncbi:substrate-binding domain-containing protein [Microbacterium resistens]|uniref:substrate-binding domain-containing protein n=1 Tax=Microbacterium resistens TaxID=156977 RepID=UPI00366C2CA6
MLAHGRHDAILRELELRGTLQAARFAERIGVSSMTLRRDLDELERQGLLVRVHGGAVSLAVAAQRDPAQASSRAPRRPVATIGMITPSASYYYPEVIRGARDAARELHCRLVLGTTNYSEREELRQAERLIAGGVDALMITPSRVRIEGTRLHEVLTEAPLPVVVVERAVEERTGGRVESVRTDHAYGAELAVRRLAELGHGRIALAARETPTSPWLIDGYTRATSRADGPDDALRAVLPTPLTGDDSSVEALGVFLESLLANGATAAIVLTDVDAVSLVDLAADRGIRVPEDLSIIAYDDEIAGLGRVPLTAVAPPKYDLGHTALRMCMDRLRHSSDAPRAVTRTAMLPRLTERDSTVPPRNVR